MNLYNDDTELMEAEKRIDEEKKVISFQFLRKFYFFLTGLIFAILSLAVQHPTPTSYTITKVIEILGWIFILCAGLLSLREIGAFLMRDIDHQPLSQRGRKWLWYLFVIGIALLMVTRILGSFENIKSIGIGTPIAERPSHTTGHTDHVSGDSAGQNRHK